MEKFLNKYKRLSLIIGIVMAVLVGLTLPAKAGNDNEDKKSSLSEEDRSFFEEYFAREDVEESEANSYYIYDADGVLVYKNTVDSENTDEKLQSLLIQSNLIMNFDNISYLVVD